MIFYPYRVSLPTRERGLKLVVSLVTLRLAKVAPHTGAWIEIYMTKYMTKGNVSLPTRERGLKYSQEDNGYNVDGRSPHGSVD